MEKINKKKNWIVSGLLVLAFVFGLFTFLGVKAPVQTVYATENPKATANQVTISAQSASNLAGTTFEDGVLTINNVSFCGSEGYPALIFVNTNVTADLKVVVNQNNFYAVFANLNGNLTIESNVNALHAYQIYAGGNLTITGIGTLFIHDTNGVKLSSPYPTRYSIAYAGEKISIENNLYLSGWVSSSLNFRSVLCAKSLEINKKQRVELTTNETKSALQTPIVFHSCNSANDLADKLVINQGALKLKKGTGDNDFDFVGYTSDNSGAMSNMYTNFDTENKAFTGYEILETDTDLIVKTRSVRLRQNGGTGAYDGAYLYLPIKTEPITVTLPECPFTAPAGKQFAGWALESLTATPLKQPGYTFVLEDGGYEYDSSNYLDNDYIVYAIWEDIPADALTGTVAINGNLKFGATLTASLTNTNNTGTLSYQWRRNGSEIAEATNNTYTLTQDDIGYTISVVVSSNVETGSLVATATEIVAKADGPVAPTGITATACTTADNNNGSISGITTAMEYKLSGASEWTDGTGATITGLNNGTYLVRLKETATHNAGEQATVVVNAYNAPTEYSITVNYGTANTITATAGTTITLTANEAEEGYEFDKWTGVGVTFADENNATTTFVMPAGNVTITATYKLISVEPQPEPQPTGLSAGAIVGIVLAVVVVGGIGGFALVWFVIKKKKWADLKALFKKK